MVRKNTQVNSQSRDLKTIGGRLVAERERLNWKQGDFCVRLAVSKSTQIKYEASANFPDARYLAELDAMGFDVLYILTGARSTEAMSEEHQNLIEAYEAASDDLKRAAFAVLLSPWKKGYLDKPIKEPGYFQHQILGEDDVRYERFKSETRSAATSNADATDEK